MGCGGSKADDSPLVNLCRERKELIKKASDHRYALAAAHLTYFYSLKDVGEVIRKFVDEELVIASASSSTTLGSPVLTLPSDEGKSFKRRHRNLSPSTSISHSVNDYKPKQLHEDNDGSHLHLSSGSELGSDFSSGHVDISDSPGHIDIDDSSGHLHIESSPDEKEIRPEMYPPGYGYPMGSWGFPGENSGMYYMKRSATPAQSFVYDGPETYQAGNVHWTNGGYSNPGYFPYQVGGVSGYSSRENYNRQQSPPTMPPSPPQVSTWDYLNLFDNYDGGGYPGYYPGNKFGYGSTTSSPDSKEVRLREGIPDLEDETEQEETKEGYKENRKRNEQEETKEGYKENRKRNEHPEVRRVSKRNVGTISGEGTSKAMPPQNTKTGSSSSVEAALSSKDSNSTDSGGLSKEENNSNPATDTSLPKNSKEFKRRKKEVIFEVAESSTIDVDSSKLSSLTTLSVHGTRDLKEAVKEIKDEFESASSHGKEVAMLLEVSSLPYQLRTTGFKVLFSRILYLVVPTMLSLPHATRPSVQLTSHLIKMAKTYNEEPKEDSNVKPHNLSSTLQKLYEWEKKLYKEVKDEERLRVIYEKECKRLRKLDHRGAESTEIDTTRASVRKLLTKIDVCITSVEGISSRIHKLRDEELEPQLTQLIHGLIRMWKSMLKCHQKQFQAIMESKVRSLKANTGFQRDSGLQATIELEMELLSWSTRFNKWISTQKSYVETLNKWLSRCILYEPEETADGVAPFSPSRIGAPPIFTICNDWYQAMVRISQKEVENTMRDFALSLHQLWEIQDEEQRQRVKAEYLSKDFEKQMRTLRMEKERSELRQDVLSEKTVVSKNSAESGISPLDDLKVDLDSMRKRLEEERARHKEAVKLVHNAASTSLQSGLLPIFEALGTFSAEALKTHEQVRLNT